ncbi:DUF5320 domain-containing protein [Candidatus Peregrinibacteria bacterium]|nr:DUF5320 domain-containing protein [Candidatus Peregrinibacteria bacterium]
MPAFDGTGPMGQGAMTGRGMGSCSGGRSWGYGGGGGYGYGRRGMGRRGFWGAVRNWMPFSPPSTSDEKDYLKGEVKYLKEDLKAAQERLKNLEEGNK